MCWLCARVELEVRVCAIERRRWIASRNYIPRSQRQLVAFGWFMPVPREWGALVKLRTKRQLSMGREWGGWGVAAKRQQVCPFLWLFTEKMFQTRSDIEAMVGNDGTGENITPRCKMANTMYDRAMLCWANMILINKCKGRWRGRIYLAGCAKRTTMSKWKVMWVHFGVLRCRSSRV